MKHLDIISWRCRFDPKMGGNRETVTLPCSFVVRLINMAQAWQTLDKGIDLIPMLNAMDREAIWADDEAKSIIEKGMKVNA